MEFTTDKQTLEDLNILGKYKPNSVFNIYNATKTQGGERLLEKMFRYPLTDVEEINRRGRIFGFFMKNQVPFPFDKEQVELVEQYLGEVNGSTQVTVWLNIFRLKMMGQLVHDKVYDLLKTEVKNIVKFIQGWKDILFVMENKTVIPEVAEMLDKARPLFTNTHIKRMLDARERITNSWFYLANVDFLLKNTFGLQIKQLLEVTYAFDVYVGVSGVATDRGFHVAKAHPFVQGQSAIAMEGVFHPGIRNAISNTVSLDTKQNVLFLTGANMAGKSTFMKAFSLAIYLGHMGFPVAAGKMDFSVQDGLYTSINVPDNLDKGYSHFYAEVLRVKHIAEEVSSGKNLVVLFDELFKGTNVKDAYEATVAVAGAFGENRNCSFIISTHIMEAGHTLREQCDNFQFVYLPTVMDGNIPRYTYQLTEGITNDRHGLRIIQNEHIVEILRGEQS